MLTITPTSDKILKMNAVMTTPRFWLGDIHVVPNGYPSGRQSKLVELGWWLLFVVWNSAVELENSLLTGKWLTELVGMDSVEVSETSVVEPSKVVSGELSVLCMFDKNVEEDVEYMWFVLSKIMLVMISTFGQLRKTWVNMHRRRDVVKEYNINLDSTRYSPI